MNRRKAIWSFVFVLVFALVSKAQDKVHLFPDRSSCVSGDTVWFNAVVLNEYRDNSGKVIHIQLDNLKNGHITKVSVVCRGNNAEGYLPIPDSLSTGVYVLKAFTNLQRSDNQALIYQRLITVYNRFENIVNFINVPQFENNTYNEIPGVSIKTNSLSAEKIEVSLELPDALCNDALELIVTARLADPLGDALSSGWISGTIQHPQEPYMAVAENKGIVVTGRVYSNSSGNPKPASIVLLSISDTLPYFDYCISDDLGRFYFYIRNAVGTGNLVFQELTDHPEDSRIELDQNYVDTPPLASEEKILTNEERDHSADLIKAAYFNKFFVRTTNLQTDTFSLQKDFQYPFYGPPTRSYYPELFVDLDNFEEISREILRGVQYRERKDEITIRLLDYGTQSVFKNEPFKLLDGIPVLDPAFFAEMGTSSIKKVDAIFYKRFFGDLDFDGIMAVYSNNPTLGWVETMPGLNLISYSCLQPELKWNYVNRTSWFSNIPDFEKVFYRERLDHIQPVSDFNFDISDIKGDIVLEIVAVCKEQGVFRTQKIISTKTLQKP